MPRPLLDQVLAQDTAVGTLRRALASGRVHHAYLFDGPEGVGKELAALGLAQALVCERRDPPSREGACGECSACTRAILRPSDKRPVHPDVVILERALYDAAQIGRRTQETQDISIDQVRTLVLARAAFPPHEGRAKVFIVRRAEELSVSAANALLKTLEEPGRDTHFILLTALADSLLPTIRSRTQRVRFAPLPDPIVARLLEAQGIDEAQRTEIARLAGGSMAIALAAADPDLAERRDAFVKRAMDALVSPDVGEALALAEDAKKMDRGALAASLEALGGAIADLARKAASGVDRAADVAAARHRLALTAVVDLDANASAQMVVESMLIRMRAV